ncbi:unannotated protein [freshwater metagenome]|uniref:Unannotated protein n=1 Tax=freshwater metagenome TaxID=449393 RepID=A0A6J6YS56_9ZZZZ
MSFVIVACEYDNEPGPIDRRQPSGSTCRAAGVNHDDGTGSHTDWLSRRAHNRASDGPLLSYTSTWIACGPGASAVSVPPSVPSAVNQSTAPGDGVQAARHVRPDASVLLTRTKPSITSLP